MEQIQDRQTVVTNARDFRELLEKYNSAEVISPELVDIKLKMAEMLEKQPLLSAFIIEPLTAFDLRKKYSVKRMPIENNFKENIPEEIIQKYRQFVCLRDGNNDIYINIERSKADELLIHGGYFEYNTEIFRPFLWYKNGKALGWRGRSSFDLCLLI